MSLLKKIVVIGPESTGKSTLSAALAAHLQTVWVDEYARAYLEQQGNAYQYEDLLAIAKGQIASEDHLAAAANHFLICDTDLYVLMVWCHHRFGKVHPFILEEIARRPYHAYILCKTDIPWTPDPQREYPNYNERLYFYNIYKDIVINSGQPFIIVEGNEEQRLAQALNSGFFSLTETRNK
ncbi:MAG TPA: ATP-binding protein [Chitinophagaceae bacterium]|nr:ATP-binding protein [Chitinophagaceae bacterium]